VFCLALNTIGFNYYKNYVFPVSVTEDLGVLQEAEGHDYYKILHINTGLCRFDLNEKEYVIIGAHMVLLNEKDRIRFSELSDVSAKLIMFKPWIVNAAFNTNIINEPDHGLRGPTAQDMFYLEQFKHNTPINRKIMPLSPSDSAVMGNKINRLHHLLSMQDTISWPCLSRSYLYEILFALVRDIDSLDDNVALENYSGYSKLTIDAIYYLQSRYSHKITIDRLAEELHTNRTTLQTDFKKHTGLSINQYLMQIRMNMAAKLIRDTGLSLKEITERIGFNDTGYFSRVFKQKFNQTPSEYMRIHRHR